jgi:hypothetical protein
MIDPGGPEADATPRWRVACDACGAGGWIGARPGGGHDAWCEGCQRAQRLDAPTAASVACSACGTPLTLAEPRFEELLGETQHVVAVLAAWCGDPGPLGILLPERPRLLGDLDPPPPRDDDPPAARAALELLAHGHFPRARASLAEAIDRGATGVHLRHALGIAAHREGDDALAERAWTDVLARDPAHGAARLDRGVLRATHGDHEGAAEDFAAAGARREARWNRAALRVIDAVQATSGAPEAATIARAREEAGEPSSYWSDHTVGRLLWTLLVERALGRRGRGFEDERILAAAERELEFDTFWDRALVVHGYARLRLRAQTAQAAGPLAARLLDALAAEPCVRGPAAGAIGAAIADGRAAVAEQRPGDAFAALRRILSRPDVRRYRVPCVHCGRGSIGVEAVDARGDPGPAA